MEHINHSEVSKHFTRCFSIHAIGKSKFLRESIRVKFDAYVVCTFVVYCIVV